MAAIAAERRVDRAAARGRAALHEREVLPRDRAALERRLQRAVGRLVAGDDEQAGRVAIEPVHDARPLRVLRRRRAPGERLHERAGRVPASGMHDHAGRLVHDEQVLILVRDAERRRRVVRARTGAIVGLVGGDELARTRWRLGTTRPSTVT